MYKLWHSFSILSLGVMMADSRGFATNRGFLPDIRKAAEAPEQTLIRGRTPGEDFHCYTQVLLVSGAPAWPNINLTP